MHEVQAAPEEPMVSLLRSQGLSPLMRSFIMHAVAMADADQEALVTSTQHQLPAAAAATALPAAAISTASATATSSGTAAEPSSPGLPTGSASQGRTSRPDQVLNPSSAVPALHKADAADAAPPPLSAASSDHQAAAASASGKSSDSQGIASSGSGKSCDNQAAPSSASGKTYENQVAASAASSKSNQAAAASASGRPSQDVLTVEQGVKALRLYLSSVGQYGPSSGAFLTAMYGCAELPQAFCRWALLLMLLTIGTRPS